ncbi:MAG TPA: methionyl-tRNA formyltransferase [Lentisphaeria bacterium]|nr:MAG: Methionyl-tRNA formyltransferase [Lentisphaerae bacterium ADurb.Bin082]HPY90362.1 methionyl-tRNA formyltransferase [Lentisphaeria bacterium]HQL86931.1 methionyl-tRNA formyltransferase [Lentisphaeria bacterium]
MPDNKPIRIYYLASGRLGIPILGRLRSDPRLILTGVGSQPDRPAGRRQRYVPTPLAAHGDALGLLVDRVPSVNTPDFLEKMRHLQVEMVVVVSFGQLLKPELLALPPFGCLNVHASMLPRFRGAAPINMAILWGDTTTGVTFMDMEAGLDTGGIYEQFSLEIQSNDNAEQLEQRLGALAAKHIGNVIWDIAREDLKPKPQPTEGVSIARKIKKEAGAIVWNNSAKLLERMVRAFTPWPRLSTLAPIGKGPCKRLQLTDVSAFDMTLALHAHPGEVIAQGRDGLLVACGEGLLHIRRVIPEGRAEMSAAEFLRGNPLPPGTILSDYPVGEK